MARLPFRDSNDLPEPARVALEAIENERGYVPNIYRVAANAPHFLPAFAEMVATSRKESALPASLKELAILEIAKLSDAQTMWASHLPLARAAGVRESLIQSLPHWHGGLDAAPEERAVLALADEATASFRVSDEAWAAAELELNSEQLAELVFVVAFYNMVARILVPLEVDLDPRYIG